MAKAVAKSKKIAAKSKLSAPTRAKAAPPATARKALKKSPAKPAPKTAAKPAGKTAGSKVCTAFCTHRPSIRTTVVFVCLRKASNRPKS